MFYARFVTVISFYFDYVLLNDNINGNANTDPRHMNNLSVKLNNIKSTWYR